MLFFHHPYVVNHLAILEHTETSLLTLEQYPLHPFNFAVLVCMLFHVFSPGHQRPAPGKGGWRWPLACGCSRSRCCVKRSTLWGLDWKCQSSLCSPAEESPVIKLNLLVMNHMPVSLERCPQSPVWHLQLWLCLGVSLAAFDMPMTNPSVVGWWSMPCAAQHHIRKILNQRNSWY